MGSLWLQRQRKEIFLNDALILVRFSLRIIFFLSVSCFNGVLWTRDAKQSSFQSKPIPCAAYTDPPAKSKLNFSIMPFKACLLSMVLLNPALVDVMYTAVYKNDQQISSAHIDLYLYHLKEGDKLLGLTGLVTDDTAKSGFPQFKTLLEDMLAQEIKLFLFSYCKSLFDTIEKYRSTKQLQLMYKIADIRRAYESTEIDNIS